MVRTQVQLTTEQAEFLRRTAAAQGVSMAQVIRAYIEEQRNRAERSREEVKRRALAALGAAHGPADASIRHDEYAVEGYQS
jgi:hypothetical protein